MLSLISIRSKYLYRHPCLLFWSYLFLPGIIFLFSMTVMRLGKGKAPPIPIQPKIEPYFSGEDYLFAELKNNTKIQRDYAFLKTFLTNITIIINDDRYCKDIVKFVKDETNFTVNCSYYTKNFTNDTTHIIKMEKIEEKYKISLIERQRDDDGKLMFTSSDLDQDTITDLFFVSNKTRNVSVFEDDRFKIYWELESFLAKMLIKLNNKEIKNDIKMKVGFNPYPAHFRYTDTASYGFSTFLAFMVSLQFSLIGYNFNMRMIDEKENKLNILLERQGISKFQYFASWVSTYYSVFSFSIISYGLFIYLAVKNRTILLFISMGLFTVAIFSACVFFTSIIKSTKTGTTAVKFFNFGSILLGFVIALPKTALITKYIFSLIPQINIFLSLSLIFSLDNFDKMSWDKLWLKSGKISYMENTLIYIFDIVLFLGLSAIIQSYQDSGLEFWDYLKSFLTHVSRKTDDIGINNINFNHHDKIKEGEKLNIDKFETHHQELSNINKQKKEQNQCLKIINCSKNYDDLKAVDNFNGELFSNEIFCLLGHNGAGKTTLVNMISGIFPPDYGDILFNGKSLVTNRQYLFENIGLCQQENIFFDYLTVQEHLEYMCEIKGTKVNRKELIDLIKKIDLYPKKDAICSTLSGGQKRKLCIALALIGGSQIILLDEPTSGMDIMARRKLWEFLKNYKKDRIILLTTHFLDEAEYLGDRIGIMSDGKYLCSGTSSFLKSKYPCGFNLNLLINEDKFDDEYKRQIFEGIQKLEPKSEIRVASKGTFCINIQPNNNNIEGIFNFIEEKKDEFGISDYTVSSTSLEDVFLKINNKTVVNDMKYIKRNISYKKSKEINKEEDILDDKDIKNYKENGKLLENNITTNFDINIKTSSFGQQLKASIIRGIYPLSRNKMLFVLELLSGLGFVYIFIFFFSDFIINATTKKLKLLDVLAEHESFFYEEKVPNFLKNSYVYNIKKNIKLNLLNKNPKDIIDFMNISYEQAKVNIAKSGIYIDGSNPDIIDVFNTEIDTELNGYLYANAMLTVSGFLKKYYDIDAIILHELEMNFFSDGGLKETFFNFFKDFIVLIIVCLIALFGFVIFLGGLMFEKIREKRYNIKYLLYLSGSNTWGYWLGFYIVDYIKLIFYDIFLMIPIFYVSGVGIYFSLDVLVISISSLSFIYFISFFCQKEEEGAKVLFIFVFGFLIVLSGLVIVYQSKLLKYSSSFTELYKLNIMDLTPVTSMGLSFLRIIISFSFWEAADKALNSLGGLLDVDLNFNQISGFYRPKYYLYTSFIAQAANFVIYTLLLIFAESGWLTKFLHEFQLFMISMKKDFVFSKEEASDEFLTNNNIIEPILNNDDKKKKKSKTYDIEITDEERNKINDLKNPLNNIYVKREKDKLSSNKELTTKIKGIRKTFFNCCDKNVRAVNNLYLGLEPNEKFGLLGFNGSGKTTTFRAIINEILTDRGSINLFGYDNKRQFKYIRTMIGYCPQINPLFDFMKVKEIIKYYSELKTSKESVESILYKFGLSKYANTYTINLSGGNKRKLTFAIAMMNKPTMLLLDEPSTGVDPDSRRVMWRNINELSNSGHKYNMILTTHSMEEAEILCDTVSWLKAGNFVCVGNPEELKVEFSKGYKLHIKFDDSKMKEIKNDKIDEVINNLKELVEGFDAFENVILENKNIYIENYLNGLIQILLKIKDKANKIKINDIRQDRSFELMIEIIKEKQKDLFIEILNLKNINSQIAELSITMPSLENILTSLN